MNSKKLFSLCEAIADISFIAADLNYETDDSRARTSQVIEWAKEFEYLHRNIQWGVNSPLDYIDSIYYFTIFKINQWHNA